MNVSITFKNFDGIIIFVDFFSLLQVGEILICSGFAQIEIGLLFVYIVIVGHLPHQTSTEWLKKDTGMMRGVRY